MITSAFINTAYYVLGFFVNLFPISTGYPQEVTTAFRWIGGYVGMLDPLIPVSTLSQTVGIVVVVELIILSFTSLSWIFSKIPIIGK